MTLWGNYTFRSAAHGFIMVVNVFSIICVSGKWKTCFHPMPFNRLLLSFCTVYTHVVSMFINKRSTIVNIEKCVVNIDESLMFALANNWNVQIFACSWNRVWQWILKIFIHAMVVIGRWDKKWGSKFCRITIDMPNWKVYFSICICCKCSWKTFFMQDLSRLEKILPRFQFHYINQA